MRRRQNARSALLCLLPGLGDALTASTLIRRLDASGYTLDVLTMLTPVAEYASALREVHNITNAPLLASISESLGPLRALRRARYDLCVVPFPATRWQYAAVARFISAAKTAIHRYGGLSSMIAGTSDAVKVPLEGGHRLWENDRLADALGLVDVADKSYLVPDTWRAVRKPGLIGIHPGTMVYKGNEARRWPFERFIELIRLQAVELQRAVRVFFGPNELEDETRVREAFGDKVEIIRAPLDEAARRLSECEVFVGNDAGFSHLAAALGVKSLVLFGMTNPTRAVPVGPAEVLRPSACPPCHDEGLRGFECVRNLGYRCLNEDMGVAAVTQRLELLIRSELPSQRLEVRGPYQLYGRAHA